MLIAPAGPLPERAPGSWLACIVTATGPIACGRNGESADILRKMPRPVKPAARRAFRSIPRARGKRAGTMMDHDPRPGGPRGEFRGGSTMDLKRWLDAAPTAVAEWQAAYPPFAAHPSLAVSDERLAGVFAEFTG